MILFLVSANHRAHAVIWASNREEAKRQARTWFGRDPDQYTVTPLTHPGDAVKIMVALNV